MKLKFLNERVGNDSSISILIDKKIIVNMQEGCIKKIFELKENIFVLETILISNLNQENYKDIGSFLLARKIHSFIKKESIKKTTIICPKGGKEIIIKNSSGIPEIIEDIELEKNIQFVYLEKIIPEQNIDLFCFDVKKILF